MLAREVIKKFIINAMFRTYLTYNASPNLWRTEFKRPSANSIPFDLQGRCRRIRVPVRQTCRDLNYRRLYWPHTRWALSAIAQLYVTSMHNTSLNLSECLKRKKYMFYGLRTWIQTMRIATIRVRQSCRYIVN